MALHPVPSTGVKVATAMQRPNGVSRPGVQVGVRGADSASAIATSDAKTSDAKTKNANCSVADTVQYYGGCANSRPCLPQTRERELGGTNVDSVRTQKGPCLQNSMKREVGTEEGITEDFQQVSRLATLENRGNHVNT